MNTTRHTLRIQRPGLWMALGALLAVGALAVWQAIPAGVAQAAVRPIASVPHVAPGSSAAPIPSLADLIEAVGPAVVNISVTGPLEGSEGPEVPFPSGTPFDEFFRHFFVPQAGGSQAPPIEREATASGFVIDPAGYIVTNHHVVEGANEITVTLQDGTRYQATLLGSDAKTDLALVKIEPEAPLPGVHFGDSDETRVGDWVLAIGNPFGLGGTATTGIVSARGRDIQSGPYDDFLQIDAPINRGNSGGPLFNLAGEVIGINSAIVSPNGGNVGIGFAIPADQAVPILAELRDQGHIERAWLGVQIQEVDPDLAEGLGLGDGHGALVVSVNPDSPASRAGLRPGDVIVRFNGEDVTKVKTLTRMVGDAKAGGRADLEVWRDGKESHLRAVLASNPDEQIVARASGPVDSSAAGKLGLSLTSLSSEARNRFGVPDDVQGALVAQVEPGSPASRRGIRPGDVVVMVGQTPVNGPAEAVDEIGKATTDGRGTVVLEVSRNGNLTFLPLRVA